jgi:hypothetical protein
MNNDTSLFPPQCCGKPIPIEVCRDRISKEKIKSFDLRVEELSAENPTHCSNRRCGCFIREKQIKGNLGTCNNCKQMTCTICKRTEHLNELCPDDEGTILLKTEAKLRKWQECQNCRNMVELERGCYHITYVPHPLVSIFRGLY